MPWTSSVISYVFKFRSCCPHSGGDALLFRPHSSCTQLTRPSPSISSPLYPSRRSTHQMYNVTMFLLFFMSLYGLLGVQFFGDELDYHCVVSTANETWVDWLPRGGLCAWVDEGMCCEMIVASSCHTESHVWNNLQTSYPLPKIVVRGGCIVAVTESIAIWIREQTHYAWSECLIRLLQPAWPSGSVR